MSRPPEVSVIIPTRDRWPLLRVTLEGALRQEGTELEVVVVDDGSEDDTPQRLAEVPDSRVRVVRHERPRGVASARNRGIAAARGKWAAFLDDDDLWSPRKLRAQLDTAESREAGFAYCAAVVVDEGTVPFYALPLPEPTTLARELLSANVIASGSSNVIARTGLLRSLGGFDERLVQLADWDLWIRLAHVAPAAVCPEVLVAYVEHPGNMLLVHEPDVWRELEVLVAKHADADPPIRLEPDLVDFARWTARGHSRAGRRLKAFQTYMGVALRHRSISDVLRGVRVLTLGKWVRPRSAGLSDPAPAPAWLDLYRGQTGHLRSRS
jgi:glycosyltransferase involved in cell wall biosynthesis